LDCALNARGESTVSDRAQLIEERLRSGLDATHVEVADDSTAHADHLGAQGGGGHFRVLVVSERFEDQSRIAAQRLVYQALGDLMRTDIHALEMRTLTPAEWEQLGESA
jgi:BolA protein